MESLAILEMLLATALATSAEPWASLPVTDSVMTRELVVLVTLTL